MLIEKGCNASLSLFYNRPPGLFIGFGVGFGVGTGLVFGRGVGFGLGVGGRDTGGRVVGGFGLDGSTRGLDGRVDGLDGLTSSSLSSITLSSERPGEVPPSPLFVSISFDGSVTGVGGSSKIFGFTGRKTVPSTGSGVTGAGRPSIPKYA